MNKIIIGIFVCVMFFGVSVTSVLSENVNIINIVGNIFYYNDTPDEEWNQTFGGTLEDRGRFVQQTSDGGYIVTGFTKSFGTGNPDIWLIKTDSDGNEQWNKRFGTLTYHEEPYSVQQTSDDGFIITGFANYDGSVGADVWLIKADSEGDEEWNQTFGGTAIDYGNSIQETTDGGYIITGATDSYGAG
jgi:predicted secreted protein